MYIILLCCLALAYLTFGLQQTLCPEQRQTYAYSTDVNGEIVKAYRENVTVHGMAYPFETMQTYLATKGLNLTKEYQGVDLSWLFDADLSGACRIYDVGRSGATSTLGSCVVHGPYGKCYSILILFVCVCPAPQSPSFTRSLPIGKL